MPVEDSTEKETVTAMVRRVKPLVMNLWTLPPKHLAWNSPRPKVLRETTVADLCMEAGILMRVTGGERIRILLVDGAQNYREPGIFHVGVAEIHETAPEDLALRVLEILAHGFHDYAARECVCGRGLFIPEAKEEKL